MAQERPAIAGDPFLTAIGTHAISTLLLGIMLTEVVPVPAQEIMPALFFFAGGLVQLINSALLLARGATFAAMFFGTFAAFWMSLSFILLGLQNGWILEEALSEAEDSGNASPLGEALGAFVISWGVLSFFWWLISLRLSLVYFLLHTLTVPAFFLAGAGFWTEPDFDNLNNTAVQAAGWLVIMIAALDFYLFLSEGLLSVGGKPLPQGPTVASLLARKA